MDVWCVCEPASAGTTVHPSTPGGSCGSGCITPEFDFNAAPDGDISLSPNIPTRCATTDFNGDGKLDFVTVNPATGTVSVLVGDGLAHLVLIGSFAAGMDPRGLAVADVNGDGRPDVVVANTSSGAISVLLNVDGMALAVASSVPLPIAPSTVAAAQFDGVSGVDLLAAGPTHAIVLSGDGNGNFAAATSVPLATAASDVAAADIDGDGDVDAVVRSDGLLQILRNSGGGTFASSTIAGPAGGGRVTLVGLAPAALPSVVTTATDVDAVYVFPNTGGGGFGAATSHEVGDGPVGLSSGDIDADGAPDFVVACRLDGSVHILRGLGDGVLRTMRVKLIGQASVPDSIAYGAFAAMGQGFAVTLTSDGPAVYLMIR